MFQATFQGTCQFSWGKPFMCDVDNLNILGNDPVVQNSRLLEGQYVFSIDGEHVTPKNIGKQPRCIKLFPWLQVSQRKCQKFGISTFSQTYTSISCLELKVLLKINPLGVIQTQFRYSLHQTFSQHFKPSTTNSEITLSLKRNQKRPNFPSFLRLGARWLFVHVIATTLPMPNVLRSYLFSWNTRRISWLVWSPCFGRAMDLCILL